MTTDPAFILTINGGSSTIKFALYQNNESLPLLLHGKIDRIGLKDATLTFGVEKGNPEVVLKIDAPDHRVARMHLFELLEHRDEFSSVIAMGHRVVHGMNHTGPELVTRELLDELHRISPNDPDHLPDEIALIEEFFMLRPKLPQFACFDTAFHVTMPGVAKLLPIPRRFDAMGIRRYGFHGLSYSYLMHELARVAGTKESQGRVILAHLGSGASLAAVYEGKSIDTSMGFTPAGGLPMSTRPGDLDPGVAWAMMRLENLTPKQFNNLINHTCGLLGISETSSDMYDLLAGEMQGDVQAAEAIELFCYQVKKWIGSFTAALGGLDTLVFAGGIGENAPTVRARICDGLGFLGVKLDEKRNMANEGLISVADNSLAEVRVIHTDEEWMIANMVRQIVGDTIRKEHHHKKNKKALL